MNKLLQVLMLFVCCFCLADDQKAKTPTAKPEPETTAGQDYQFTIATYNINWGNVDLKGTAKLVKDSQCDVVCLQETNSQSKKVLSKALKKTYPHQKFINHNRAGGYAILSKFPIKKSKVVKKKFGLFHTQIAVLTIDNRQVQIVNVHLKPTMSTGVGGTKQFIQQLITDDLDRLKEIDHINKKIDKKLPTIFAGDFNSLWNMSPAVFLTTRKFIDSFRSVTKNTERHPTWRWKIKGILLSFRVDYIFHAAGFKTLESKVVTSNFSDHHLLYSKLAFPKKAKADGETTKTD